MKLKEEFRDDEMFRGFQIFRENGQKSRKFIHSRYLQTFMPLNYEHFYHKTYHSFGEIVVALCQTCEEGMFPSSSDTVCWSIEVLIAIHVKAKKNKKKGTIETHMNVNKISPFDLTKPATLTLVWLKPQQSYARPPVNYCTVNTPINTQSF